MDLSYIKVNGNTATVLLYQRIGKDAATGKGIDGAECASEIYSLAKAGFDIKVRIHSSGGKAYDGISIMSAIRDCGADTYIDGFAVSTASFIALSGKKVYALLMQK